MLITAIITTAKSTNDVDLSSMQDDLKKINKYLKLGKIEREIKVLEVTQAPGVLKDKLSFYFQRTTPHNLYTPSTKYGLSKKSRNRETLFKKSLKSFGFTSKKYNCTKEDRVLTNFEDVFHDAGDHCRMLHLRCYGC